VVLNDGGTFYIGKHGGTGTVNFTGNSNISSTGNFNVGIGVSGTGGSILTPEVSVGVVNMSATPPSRPMGPTSAKMAAWHSIDERLGLPVCLYPFHGWCGSGSSATLIMSGASRINCSGEVRLGYGDNFAGTMTGTSSISSGPNFQLGLWGGHAPSTWSLAPRSPLLVISTSSIRAVAPQPDDEQRFVFGGLRTVRRCGWHRYCEHDEQQHRHGER